MEITKDKIKAAVEITMAIAETIRALGEVPSGELWARVMAHLSIEQYEKIIQMLVNAGVVVQTPAHVLRWNVKPA